MDTNFGKIVAAFEVDNNRTGSFAVKVTGEVGGMALESIPYVAAVLNCVCLCAVGKACIVAVERCGSGVLFAKSYIGAFSRNGEREKRYEENCRKKKCEKFLHNKNFLS